jgi:hypothetical protein
MILVDKFFENKKDLKTLKKIALHEITTNPLIAEGYPKWQSQGFMQNKYSETSAMKYLVKKSLEITRSHFNNKSLEILSLWFVVNKKGQKYPWHFHEHKATAIIYLNKCKNKGTLFMFNNIPFQLYNVKNNNAFFFDGKIDHAPPSDDSKNRITCAIDFD